MKRTTRYLAAAGAGALLFALASCNLPLGSASLSESSFGPGYTGSKTLDVPSSAKTVTLFGDVTMQTGELDLQLTDPNGKKEPLLQFTQTTKTSFNKQYTAIAGTWKLTATSVNSGSGSFTANLQAN